MVVTGIIPCAQVQGTKGGLYPVTTAVENAVAAVHRAQAAWEASRDDTWLAATGHGVAACTAHGVRAGGEPGGLGRLLEHGSRLLVCDWHGTLSSIA